MGIVDLNAIKESLQTTLLAANTTTASVDLSANMVNRVTDIFKVNFEKLWIQASSFPAVTCWVDQKNIRQMTIANGQPAGTRDSVVTIKVAGIVWNSNIATYDEDPADEDVENLMENIESILRSNVNLSGTAHWCYPTAVTYHSMVAEQAHQRIGLMDLSIKTFGY